MTPLQEQFKILQDAYPQALLTQLPDGSNLITVPDFDLPPGWSKMKATVKFLAPVGYPFGRPDCFWADFELRLANGNPPQRSGFNPIPNAPGQHLWFSWHLSVWNPNSDKLLTYLYVIKRRFNDAT